jgi:hypothetical protein
MPEFVFSFKIFILPPTFRPFKSAVLRGLHQPPPPQPATPLEIQTGHLDGMTGETLDYGVYWPNL